MGETVREHADIQGFILRTMASRDRILNTERDSLLEQPTVHYGHTGHQPCSHPLE